MTFPKGFLLGASTAAHQVEGNNIHSDLWAQEHMKYTSFAEPSGDAVDHYRRYAEDIALLAGAGLNAYREFAEEIVPDHEKPVEEETAAEPYDGEAAETASEAASTEASESSEEV